MSRCVCIHTYYCVYAFTFAYMCAYVYIYGCVYFVVVHERCRVITVVPGFMGTLGRLEEAIPSPTAPVCGCHWPVWLSFGSPLWGAAHRMGDT